MRFILCALDPKSGDVTVVMGRAYPTRTEALEAASKASAADMAGAEVFVVDLEKATPVVVLPGAHTPGTASGPTADAEAERAPTAAEEWPFVPSDLGGVGPSTLATDSEDENADRAQVWWLETGAEAESEAPALQADVAQPDLQALGAKRVDFDAWTCSDCIFLSTCTKTETHRPATCGSFQWKPE